MHEAHVVHHIPGRIRIKLPDAKGNRALLEDLKAFISPLSGVRRVDVNPATGSVLVHYDPEANEDYRSHLAILAEHEKLFSLELPELTEADKIAAKVEAEAEFLAGHSETARNIVNLVKYVNEVVKKETNNVVDLKVLLPLGLAIYAFFEVGSELSTPLWVTLGIFSFNSFVRLHVSTAAVHTADHHVFLDDPDKTSVETRRTHLKKSREERA
jgi:Heavy metal associated domain 2